MLSVSATTLCSKTVLVDRWLCPKPTACTRKTVNQVLNKAWSMLKLSCSMVNIVTVVVRQAVKVVAR